MQEFGMPSLIPGTDIADPINGEPTSNKIPHELGKIQATNQYVNNAFARINHMLTDKSFYELTLS